MGVCNSTNNTHRESKRTNPTTELFNRPNVEEPKIQRPVHKSTEPKQINPNCEIENIQNTTIIRHINDIQGDAVNISKCENSTIIIMDTSAQVTISECNNCKIYIAPSKHVITLRSSKNIFLISASNQFRCSDIEDCSLALFTISQPSIERAKRVKLGCFCFRYTELPELFVKAELCVWDNKWSEYHDFNVAIKSEIEYFNVSNDKVFINAFSKELQEQESHIDSYQPVPFTNGLSMEIQPGSQNVLIFIKERQINSHNLYIHLEHWNKNLMKTKMISKSEGEYTSFFADLEMKVKKNELREFIQNNQSQLGATKNSTKDNSKSSFIVLWMNLQEDDSKDELKDYFEGDLENSIVLSKEEVDNIDSFVTKLFNNFRNTA